MSNFDLNSVKESDVPLIVFSDRTSGLIEFLIKWRTKGDWNHVMWLSHPGFFASQGNTYSEVPYSRYMGKNSRLKIVEIVGLSDYDKNKLKSSITSKLNGPWHKKLYDWLGIAGQAIGIKKINTPGLNYCSEDVIYHMKIMAKDTNIPQSKDIMGIPDHASPQGLNEYMKVHQRTFQVVGKWEADDEVVIDTIAGRLRFFACLGV